MFGVAADELQVQVGQLREGHAGGQLDGVGIPRPVGGGQQIRAVSGPQLHPLQRAVVVGLGRIYLENRRCGDVLAGIRHDEGGNIGIRCNSVFHSGVVRVLDVPAFQHVSLALGCGGQGDGLILERQFAGGGFAAVDRDGGAAHGGGVSLGGHGGEDLRPEFRRDRNVVPRQNDVGVRGNSGVCHILRVIRAVFAVDHDLPAEEHPGFLPVSTIEIHLGRTSCTVHILCIARVAVDLDRRGPVGGGAPCDRGADVFKFREKRDIRIRHLEGHLIRLALFLGQFDAGLVLPLLKRKLIPATGISGLRRRRDGLARKGGGYGGPALIGEDNIALPVLFLIGLIFPKQ